MERTVVNCTPHFRLFSDSCQTARERCLQEFWSCCCISGYSKLPMQRLPFSFPSDDRSLPAKVHFRQAAAESWKCYCYATHEMPEMQQTKMSFCCSYKNPPCYKNKEGEATPDTLNDQITQESLAFAVFAITNVKLKCLFAVLLCVQTIFTHPSYSFPGGLSVAVELAQCFQQGQEVVADLCSHILGGLFIVDVESDVAGCDDLVPFVRVLNDTGGKGFFQHGTRG